jgi:Ca2+-binding EF-hand superfamily protein
MLICMGEMITDEEVDMMVNMVDGDGDGQARAHPPTTYYLRLE